MAGLKKVTYIGNDKGFFHKLKERMAELYAGSKFEFKEIGYSDKSKCQSLIAYIPADTNFIYIDLSSNTEEMLHLCRILKRSNHLKHIFTTALFDSHATRQTFEECIISGVEVNHVKSSEIYDVIYDSMIAAFSEEVLTPPYAVAELNDEVTVYEPIKIGYITHEYIHVETNTALNMGEEVVIKSFFDEKKILYSKKFQVKEIKKQNIFYNFDTSYDLKYVYADIKEEGDSKRYVEELELAKEKLSEWIKKSNKNATGEKKTRILIVDSDLTLYRDNVRTDTFPYVFRIQAVILKVTEEMDRLRPNIIVIQLDQNLPPEATYKNDLALVKNFVSYIKSQQNYEPFFVIFNTTFSKMEIKQAIDYDKFIASKDPITTEALAKMAQIFETKIHGLSYGPKKGMVYLSKGNPDSIMEIERKITVTKISESEISFKPNFNPPMLTSYRIGDPINLFFTVVPFSKSAPGEKGEFHGVLHTQTEEDKERMRRFIDSVFFREHDAKKQEELDELAKKGEDYSNKKAETKLSEEAKKTAEALEKKLKQEEEAAKKAKEIEEKKKTAQPK